MGIITDLGAKDVFLENLKLLMAKRDMSYKDLADLIGISKQQVGNIFSDRSDGISTNTTDKISAALGLKETELFSADFKKKYK